ncbi:MAG: DUF748 domain-containing protein [Candidatus Omnitrophota bacterium]|nr:DUF748 domain-containing protein [Candidatus Omnitrophota bacterium]
MLKKILTVLVILAIVFFAAAYLYRQAIVQYYGEKFIRDNLPGYIKIDKIKFDLGNNVFSMGGLKILNPPGYLSKYALAIEEVRCVYRIKGVIVPNGLDILEISFKKPEIAVERLPESSINLVEMSNFVSTFPAKAPSQTTDSRPETIDHRPQTVDQRPRTVDQKKSLKGVIKLPQNFGIKGGKLYFIDSVPYQQPYEIIIDSVNGEVSMSFNDSYTAILDVAFTLEGNLNGVKDETLKWIARLDPKTPKLTMSNRFEVSNLDILTFKPYYDAQSPIVFERGKFSGELIFDFDNGNIGSTNEIRLSDIALFVKEGHETGQFWETSVPDLIRYFTSSSGDIIFDFKIKGDMAHPQFYLGPISKRALASMAIDKISSYAINQITKPANAAAGGTVDKAADYINMFKGLIKKR